ncbi:MAG: hypothetical protein M3304_04095 [Actinomycetota bacterium]|nr:hypothetical protein [Actinomycetota bacterium]
MTREDECAKKIGGSAMFHPETAYEFAKERQFELERAAREGSPVLALLARLVRRRSGERRPVA